MDLMKNPRIAGCDVDIGAYEVQLATLNPPAIPSGEAGYAKNRYISFDPANGDQFTALRVVLTDTLDSRFDDQVGLHWWVGPPETYCENAGEVQAANCQESVGGLAEIDFAGAQLQCQPYYMDWSTVGTVHVFDTEIIPDSTYQVQAIGYGCALGDEDAYSDPLDITTSKWADVTGQYLMPHPPSPPDGAVNITDVTTILDKFNNTLPILKARTDIDPSPPDVDVNITDVMQALDAFRGFPYPLDDVPFEECEDPPPVGGCEADIRVDSNNDGVIDFIDDFLEETIAMDVSANGDDDNGNDIPDSEEDDWQSGTLIIEGEDDLAEMQLSSSSCATGPGMWQTWSLSWNPEAPLRVWWYADKSSGVEPPRNMNDYLANPEEAVYPIGILPLLVWLEPTDTYADLDMTFTIHRATSNELKAARARQEETKDDKAKTKSHCTWRQSNPTHITLDPNGAPSGVVAQIKTRTVNLCNSTDKDSGSVAWIGLGEGQDPQSPGFLKWVQMGFWTLQPKGSTQQGHFVYVEQKNGSPADDPKNPVREVWRVSGPASSIYGIELLGDPCYCWSFNLDDNSHPDFPFHFADRPDLLWVPSNETAVTWSTEIFHKQDQAFGTETAPCEYRNCRYKMGGTWLVPGFQQTWAKTEAANEWGIAVVGQDGFDTYDKRPNE